MNSIPTAKASWWVVKREQLQALARDDRGDVPIGTILVIALIVIPLLLLLIFYRDEVVTFFQEQWDRVMGSGEYSGPGGD